MDINFCSFLSFIFFLINVVSANLGLFGYDAFATHNLIRTPMEKESECVSWDIDGTSDVITDKFATVEIKPGCITGIRLEYSDDNDSRFFSPFKYYSDLEIDLIVLSGKLDIRIEEPDSDKYFLLKSIDETEFTENQIQNYNFTSYVCPISNDQDNEYSVINFSNPDPEKSVKFYMRRARLIYITPRPVLDNLKLYGNDWSYNYINSSFTNNVMFKYLHPQYGCISIDIKEPYVEPWASLKFEIKAPPDLIVYTGLEIEGDHYATEYVDGYTFNEDEWTTVEVEYKKMLYDRLYDRLDICNGSLNISWMKIRNVYFEPRFHYEQQTAVTQSCCVFNQCICTVQYKKIYIRRNATNTIPDPHLNSTDTSEKSNSFSIFTHPTSLLSNILLISVLLFLI